MNNRKASREKYWKKHIESYFRTSMTQRAYCRKNNLSYWSFRNWKRMLDGDTGGTELVAVPASVLPDVSPMPSALGIEINRSLRITISRGFDPELLVEVIKALGIEL